MALISKDGKHTKRLKYIQISLHYSVRRTAHVLEEIKVLMQYVDQLKLESGEKQPIVYSLAAIHHYVRDINLMNQRLIKSICEEMALTAEVKKQLQRVESLTKELDQYAIEISKVSRQGMSTKQLSNLLLELLRLEEEIEKEES